MQVITEKIVAAVSDLHRNREVQPLVDLFTDDASLTKVGMPHEDRGKEGAQEFWQRYRDGIEAFRTYYDTAAFLSE